MDSKYTARGLTSSAFDCNVEESQTLTEGFASEGPRERLPARPFPLSRGILTRRILLRVTLCRARPLRMLLRYRAGRAPFCALLVLWSKTDPDLNPPEPMAGVGAGIFEGAWTTLAVARAAVSAGIARENRLR